MSDEFEKLSNVLGAKEAARILDQRRLDREAFAADHGISPQHLPCTCGSGGHPRKCDRHPWAYQQHIVDLNHDALRDAHEELSSKVEALEKRLNSITANMFEDYSSHLDAAMRRIEALEKLVAKDGPAIDQLLDRVNQLVEYHGILPITKEPIP